MNNISGWWEWWNARRYHIVPVFRGFGLSGLNLAEVGHTTLQPGRKKFRLLDAAFKDTASIMVQDEQYLQYMRNETSWIGRGLNLKMKHQRDRNLQRKRGKQYGNTLIYGDVLAELSDNDSGEDFIPTQTARHRAPEVPSSQNPTQSSQVAGSQRSKKTKFRKKTGGIPHLVNSDCSSDSSIHEDEQISVEADIDIEYVNRIEATKIVFLNKSVQKCYGCGQVFDHEKMSPPDNLIICKKHGA